MTHGTIIQFVHREGRTYIIIITTISPEVVIHFETTINCIKTATVCTWQRVFSPTLIDILLSSIYRNQFIHNEVKRI